MQAARPKPVPFLGGGRLSVHVHADILTPMGNSRRVFVSHQAISPSPTTRWDQIKCSQAGFSPIMDIQGDYTGATLDTVYL